MNSLTTIFTARSGSYGRSFGEQAVHVGEGFELQRVAERIEEEHRRLLPRLALEARVRLDDEFRAGCAEAGGGGGPWREIGDDAEMAYGNVMTIDQARRVGHAARGDLVRDDLVTEEIEVHPVLAAAAFVATEEFAVNEVRRGEVR